MTSTTPNLVGPNLGCPEILSPEAINEDGFRIILAVPSSDHLELASSEIVARPSFRGEGQEFLLALNSARKLEDELLPTRFEDVSETRLLISTTLRTKILPGCVFWELRAKPKVKIHKTHHCRNVRGVFRSTLYDLALSVRGVTVSSVRHAVCLRIAEDDAVKFVHLTDLHLAARNDLWEAEVKAVIEGSHVTPGEQQFRNFNGCFREFIGWANEAANEGQLDFIWALGDLVDFCRTGLFDRTPGDNNWSTFIEMVVGSAAEDQRDNPGLRLPLFTTTGNHDWRTYPYSPVFRLDIFGITKKCAEELDFWYRNTSEEIGKKLEEVNQDLMRKGSPLLARSWWGAIASMGLRGVSVGLQRLGQRTKAIFVSYWRQMLWTIFGVGGAGAVAKLGIVQGWNDALKGIHLHYWDALAVICALLVFLFASLALPPIFYERLRTTLDGLIAIEAEVSALSHYFLDINPYFNYAFQLGNCYFVVLDTGPDCLTAQSFWDQGGKKVKRISIKDNILGGSPDTMGFYPANEFYPYSQIAWLENVLNCIERDSGSHRIFAGLHAPPANLSAKQRDRAEGQLALNLPSVTMKRGEDGYDIRYGTVNHYLSQFFFLCLGFRENARSTVSGPRIDAVFAGHAHWNMEFELRKPQSGRCDWSPELLYGNFSEKVEADSYSSPTKWGPLLLQTAACGPQGAVATEVPPNFRYVVVGNDGRIHHLRPCNLEHPPRLGAPRAAAASGK